jgi:nucleoside-diphosphate-sugar epimerase
MSRKVLVTGASGFTGSHLANRLADLGYHVRGFIRPASNVRRLQLGKMDLVTGDLRKQRDVDQAVRGVDWVFHIGALYRSVKEPDRAYWESNVAGTGYLLEAARRHGVQRLVHCSTIGVHGDVREVPGCERSPLAPGDIYQVTKLAGERLAHQAAAAGLPVVVARPAGIYGPGDLRFWKLFSLVQRGRFVMFGTGQTYLHLVYIDDLVDGLILCAQVAASCGQTYILAGDRYVSLNELVALVAAAVDARRPPWRLPFWPLQLASTLCEGLLRPWGVEPPLHRRRAAFFIKNRAFSIAKARRELGYAPRVDLETGLRRTADWYRRQNLLA